MIRPAHSTVCLHLGLGVLLLSAAVRAETRTNSSPATGTNTTLHAAPPPARLDYASFRVISERNIFSAGRSGRAPVTTREERRPIRVEAFGLVGTLLDGASALAFFDGSSSEFRKALKPDASIAGWKLVAITPHSAQITAGTNTLDLRVGMMLRREDEGPWHLMLVSDGGFAATAGGGSSGYRGRSERSGSASTPAAPAGGGTAGSPADASEILKRLMERRAKEGQ